MNTQGKSCFDSLKEALMDPMNGVVKVLEHDVKWGYIMYDIAAMYPLDPLGGSTPTDKALDVVLSHPPAAGTEMLDGTVSPTIVVLATDGAPNDFCSNSFAPVDVRPNVFANVKKLLAANIKTYVISLAGSDQMLTQHLQDVAAAGGTILHADFPCDAVLSN